MEITIKRPTGASRCWFRHTFDGLIAARIPGQSQRPVQKEDGFPEVEAENQLRQQAPEGTRRMVYGL